MISSRFVKFPYCSGILYRFPGSSLLQQNVKKYHHYRKNVLLNNVEKTFARFLGEESDPRCLYSTASPETQLEREVPLRFVHLMDDDGEVLSNQLRNLLYAESNDEIIMKLKSCTSDDEVYSIINQIEQPKPKHLVQALLVVRDLHKVDILYHTETNTFTKTNSSFRNLVEKIMNSVSQLNIDELSTSALYLSMFDLEEEKLRLLISTYEDKIKEMDERAVSALSLAQVCIVLESFQNLWASNTILNFLPVINEKMVSCDSYTDFRRITTCCRKIRFVLSASFLEKYMEKCSFLMERNEDITSEIDRLKAILRCIQFLNFMSFQGNYSRLFNDLLLSIRERVYLLPVRYIYLLHSILFGTQEPQQIFQELKSLVKLKLSQGTIKEQLSAGAAMDLRAASLLYSHIGEKRRSECIYSLQKYLDSVDLVHDFQLDYAFSFLNTLQNLQKHDTQLADKYWNQVVKSLNKRDYSQRADIAVEVCNKYVSYSIPNNYSNLTFETHAFYWLKEIAIEKKIIFSPHDRCMVELLILFFNFDINSYKAVCDYYIDNVSRFEARQPSFMSIIFRGIKSRLRKSRRSSLVLYHYVKTSSAFNTAAVENLKKKKDLKIDDCIQFFRIYSYGEGSKSTELYRLIIDRLNQMPVEALSSRRILSLIPTSFVSRLFEPRLIDKMVQFFLEQKDVVSLWPTVQLLKLMYSFGYTPERCEEFIDLASLMIVREKEELSAHYLIFSAISLCYFNSFPRQLADYIFNVEFLDYIDTEMSTMSDKKNRYFHLNFLDLNRAACLDFPSSDLPWFHENYCKEKFSLKSGVKSSLQKELQQILSELINNDKALQTDCTSPYYHEIDFVLHTNKNGEPVDPSKCSPQDLRKIAILLNSKSSSSSYYLGKGLMDMKIRQLEILGYKVAVIDGHLWNSMHMAEPTAKEDYLCNAIWSDRSL